jgi:hypothetical protein
MRRGDVLFSNSFGETICALSPRITESRDEHSLDTAIEDCAWALPRNIRYKCSGVLF